MFYKETFAKKKQKVQLNNWLLLHLYFSIFFAFNWWCDAYIYFLCIQNNKNDNTTEYIKKHKHRHTIHTLGWHFINGVADIQVHSPSSLSSSRRYFIDLMCNITWSAERVKERENHQRIQSPVNSINWLNLLFSLKFRPNILSGTV